MNKRLRSMLRLAALAALGTLVVPGAADALWKQDQGNVLRVPITGVVELGLAPFVERAIKEAEDSRAAAVVLDIDTPGGRVDAAWAIVDAIRDAEVPVYAFVNRRALSAGAMIALATDRIYMRDGATIGAATPVVGDGEKASEKMVSAMRSEFRVLAEDRGLDPLLAEAMVDESIEVEGVIEAGKLLTLTTAESVSLGLAESAADDLGHMLDIADLQTVQVVSTAPNWAERIVRFLTNPVVAPMLLSLGFLGLLIEIRTPSFGLAGSVGLGALAAFFGAHYLVHLAGMEEMLLFAAGAILIALEILVIPGFGIAGILGGVAIATSTVLGLVGQFPTADQVVGAIGMVSASVILVGVAAWIIIKKLPGPGRMSGLFLWDSTSRQKGYLSVPARSNLVGSEGVAATDLRPAGTMILNDERIDVVAEGPLIKADTRVKVVGEMNSRLVVRELETSS